MARQVEDPCAPGLRVGEVVGVPVPGGWVRAVLTEHDPRASCGAWFVYLPVVPDVEGLREPFALPPRGEELVAGHDTTAMLVDGYWSRPGVVVAVPAGEYHVPWSIGMEWAWGRRYLCHYPPGELVEAEHEDIPPEYEVPDGVLPDSRGLTDVVRDLLEAGRRAPLPRALAPVPPFRPGPAGTSRYLLDDPRGIEAVELVRDLFTTGEERVAYVGDVLAEALLGRDVGWHAAVAVQLVCAWLRPDAVLGALMLPDPARVDWWRDDLPAGETAQVRAAAVAAVDVLLADPSWLDPIRDAARGWLVEDLRACRDLLRDAA